MATSSITPFLILMGITMGPIVVPLAVIALIAVFTDSKKGKPDDTRIS
jgi:hypothetical protein